MGQGDLGGGSPLWICARSRVARWSSKSSFFARLFAAMFTKVELAAPLCARKDEVSSVGVEALMACLTEELRRDLRTCTVPKDQS